MFLTSLDNMRSATVAGLSCPPALRSRLGAFGLLPGCRLRMLRNSRKGSLVIELRGSFLALSRKIAGQIEVEEAI